MDERLSTGSYLKVPISFISSLLVGQNAEETKFEHKFVLTERGLTKIKIGSGITDEYLEFLILDYMGRTEPLKTIAEEDSKFIIINFKLLSTYFHTSDYKTKLETFSFLKVKNNIIART
jgi:hypothetical protein